MADAVDIAYFLEARTQQSRRALRRRAGRGLDHDGARRGANQRDSQAVPLPGHDRRVRDGRRHPGAAQLGQRRRLHQPRLRSSRVHQDARHQHADRRPRDGRFRAARLPDQQAPTRGAGRRAGSRPQAARADVQRVRRVQAARHGVRGGGPGHRLPRSGDAGRLRRDLSQLQPRVLRLLRTEGAMPIRSVSAGTTRRTARRRTTSCGCCETSTATHRISAQPATSWKSTELETLRHDGKDTMPPIEPSK